MMIMTEKEKSYLTENARFYCAEGEKNTVRKSSHIVAVLCAVSAGLCILWQAYPSLCSADCGRIIAAVSRAGAEIEQMSLRFGDIWVNDTEENVNNISSTISTCCILFKVFKVKVLSSIN